jgi:hypothetical protein
VTRPGRPGTATAFFFGGAAGFLVGERLVETIRPALLLDPDPGWAVSRFLLWLGLISAVAASAGLAAGLTLLWVRSRLSPQDPEPLPFRKSALVLIGLLALAAGALFRFAWLDTLPMPLWLDDVSLIDPTLALQGSWSDFENSIRPAPYGVDKPFGSVGVLYLELYRLCLKVGGTTVFGVRLPSALAGVASVGTAMLLARALLPAGGGALAGLILAGMRWNLILSRWGWNAIVLAPVLDVAALVLLAARRRRSAWLAAAAGIVAGLATHVYLASWIGAAALFLLAAWPAAPGEARPWRPVLVLPFVVALAATAAPIFLLKEERTSPYFARASDHNVALEVRRAKSVLPLFGVAADALAAPWLSPDPTPRHDLPGRTRLGWLVGALSFVGFVYAVVRPRREFSGFLLAHAAAAFAATVVGGRALVPNGYRFGYLSNVAAVAAAGGTLVVLGRVAPSKRRTAAIALTGALAIASLAGARDAILVWAGSRQTFDDFWGYDTLIARSAARWDAYGSVDVDEKLAENVLTVRGARKYRLDPWDRNAEHGTRTTDRREFRIVAPATAPRSGERLVEKIQDAWGREWAWVYASRLN